MKAEEPSGYSSGAITIGNPYLFYAGCEDNGEPICVMFHTNGQINYYIDTNVFGTERKIHQVIINEITEGIVNKLDPRLVPNVVDLTGYATEEYVDGKAEEAKQYAESIIPEITTQKTSDEENKEYVSLLVNGTVLFTVN
jgi:hypothetical protein